MQKKRVQQFCATVPLNHLYIGGELSAVGSALIGGLTGTWSSLVGSTLLGELVTGPLGWIVLGHEGT